MTTTVQQVMTAFDRQEYDVLLSRFLPDAQGVDEISRRWLRDTGEVDAYFKQLEGSITGTTTELSDLREDEWGDVGLVTGWMEQDYTLDGQALHVSAPFTFVLRRTDGEWRVALLHAVALPPEG